MIKEERLKIILREINLYNKVLSSDLSELLNVSEDTVRRDLKELVEADLVTKVHGGAINKSLTKTLKKEEEVYGAESKVIIAQKATQLLKRDQVILIEGGTTIQSFAKHIPVNFPLHFFTISPQTAISLSENEGVVVNTVGGQLHKDSYLHTGSEVVMQLKDIRANLCLLGANGFSVENGLSDIDWEIVQVKKAMMQASKKTAILCISEKLNSNRKFIISEAANIDYLITELDTDSPLLKPYMDFGINVL
ncbi:DeoR/GlpR family DNA-binding transcription regulator [Sphingobacterium faecale]|uniref:DeoR/GlpR transcriptional regulator n=1 Tax=Sphingobacterium faecale TaxID=2803775 RepID=A0ABS1RAC1_9SPHI|nr:DeoR/GlpR family DNA-binding transcription regulator [Sphingobacterium faecale]MBL1410977.1 DeoR/GlpR transcriptional regulator [Sphingobacterium faecale]